MTHTGCLFQRWDSDGGFSRLRCARAGAFLTASVIEKKVKVLRPHCPDENHALISRLTILISEDKQGGASECFRRPVSPPAAAPHHVSSDRDGGQPSLLSADLRCRNTVLMEICRFTTSQKNSAIESLI